MPLSSSRIRDIDGDVGGWLSDRGEPYVYWLIPKKEGGGIVRAYAFHASKAAEKQKAKLKGSCAHAKSLFAIYSEALRPENSEYYFRAGRLWAEGKPLPSAPPPTPYALSQTNGSFPIYQLVCGNFTPDEALPSGVAPLPSALPSGGCSPYGSKMSRALIKVAATRIFANPYQSFTELLVNSYDSAFPEQKVGKFGMGFFSVLWWLYESPLAKMTIRSYHPGECWSLEIKLVKTPDSPPEGDLYGELKMHPRCQVTVWGTEIEISTPNLNPEMVATELAKFDGLKTLGNVGVTRKLEGAIIFSDTAKGIPLKVLATSLLVPSVSTKSVAGFGTQRLRTKVRSAPGEESKGKVMIGVGLVVVVSIQVNIRTYIDITLGLPANTHLPVSRDDIIISEETKKELETQIGIALTARSPVVLATLESFVKIYALGGAAPANVEAFESILESWRSRNYHRMVPWEHYNDCYRLFPATDEMRMVSYDYRPEEIEKALPNLQDSPWLNTKLCFVPVPLPTYGGLFSVIFTPTPNVDKISKTMNNFLIAKNPAPGSIDDKIRTRGITALGDIAKKVSRHALDAYVYLISIVSVRTDLQVHRDGTGTMTTEDPVEVFVNWMRLYHILPDKDLITVISFIASNFRDRPDLWVHFNTCQLTKANQHIFVSAILRSRYHLEESAVCVSPYIDPADEIYLETTKTMEEYATLAQCMKNTPLEKDVTFHKFIIGKFRATTVSPSMSYPYAFIYKPSNLLVPFSSDVAEWAKAFANTTDKARSFQALKNTLTWSYTTKQLVSSLFGGLDISQGEREFYQHVRGYPPTKLQTLDIATNDASTRHPVVASLVELYQNATDAGAKKIVITSGLAPSTVGDYPTAPPEGHAVIEFTDDVGMREVDFFHVQIPFLSTKTAGGNSAGEMGSGFFNVFRQASVVRIETVRDGIRRVCDAIPVRDASGRVTDINNSVSIAKTKQKRPFTTIHLHFPCHSVGDRVEILATVDRIVRLLAMSPLEVTVLHNGKNAAPIGIRMQQKGRFGVYVYKDDDFGLLSLGDHACYTKGVYFGPSTTIDPELSRVTINLFRGFDPVHSRSKINLKPEILARIKFYAFLLTGMIPNSGYVHKPSQSLPAINDDSSGRFLSYPIRGSTTFYDLLVEYARRNGDRHRGDSAASRKIVDQVVADLLGDLPDTSGFVRALNSWAYNKVADPPPTTTKPKTKPKAGGKTTEAPEEEVPAVPQRVQPEYSDPPTDIKKYMTTLVERYCRVCRYDPTLGMRKAPKVKFYSNPNETGTLGFCQTDYIALGIPTDRYAELSKAIKGLSSKATSIETGRELRLSKSWTWAFLAWGDAGTGHASTLVHELEHYRRNETEVATAHAPRELSLFGLDKIWSFDEAAIAVSRWVTTKEDIYLS